MISHSPFGSRVARQSAPDRAASGTHVWQGRDLIGIDVAADAAASRIQATVEQAIAKLEGASTDAGAYCGVLDGVTAQLGAGIDDAAARLLIASLTQATRSIIQKNSRLKEELERSTAQLKAISSELGDARREAWTDALTGLANRARFDLALEAAAVEATRQGQSLCLLLLDVDHFKRFNDTHGHAIGDEVLRLMGDILRQMLKGQDTSARYGGEEFAVIMPNTTLEEAEKVAHKLRQRVSARALKNKRTGTTYGVVTVSIGAAQLRQGDSPETLLERADKALYKAKTRGRDCVVADHQVPVD